MADEDFERFVAARYGELLHTAYLLTGSLQDAEDLVQACLLKIWPRFERIADPLPYLRRAMVNQRTSWWRRVRRELLSAEPPERRLPDPSAALTERTALVAELARLPKRMRTIVVLRCWEGLSCQVELLKVRDCR